MDIVLNHYGGKGKYFFAHGNEFLRFFLLMIYAIGLVGVISIENEILDYLAEIALQFSQTVSWIDD